VLDELLRLFANPADATDVPTLAQAALATATSFALSIAILLTYRRSHSGAGYSQAFAQTLVLLCVVTSVVMLIIGSNIARAFSLVGALSIIRFRTAIKDPRDVAFVFLAMAVGMATGTQLHAIALVFTCLVCTIVLLMSQFDVGALPAPEMLLRIVGDRALDPQGPLAATLQPRTASLALLGIEQLDPETTELVYSLRLRGGALEHELLEALRAVPGVRRSSLLPGQHVIGA